VHYSSNKLHCGLLSYDQGRNFKNCENLKNKKSAGEDEMPTFLIKQVIDSVIDPLTHIVNESLSNGIYPDQLKIAVVKALFKKGDPYEVSNYRPISLLTSFSKIFEYIVYIRIYDYMTSCNFWNKSQHGFLKGKSVETAIFEFTRAIYQHLDSDCMCCGLLIDLTKAFDCLNHNILLAKLERYGFSGQPLKWINSYLTNRKQKVVSSNNGYCLSSSYQYISNGVPQGSILGPLLFIIYINDMPQVIECIQNTIVNYADDTNVLVTSNLYPELLQTINECMAALQNWFSNNKLILNTTKTSCILFKQKNAYQTPKVIKMTNSEIEYSTSVKLLGLHLDETLAWEVQTKILLSRLSSVCYGIRVLSGQANEKTLVSVYYANFYSLMSYGVIFWGNSANVNSIFIIQKKVIRIMYKKPYKESCRGVFKIKNLLTFYGLYIYKSLVFFFQNNHYFKDYKIVQDHYDHRDKNVYHYPQHRLTKFEKSTLYVCIKLFNKLPVHLKNICELSDFKRKLFKYLVNIEPYNVKEFFEY
jgi:hypothetical protein